MLVVLTQSANVTQQFGVLFDPFYHFFAGFGMTIPNWLERIVFMLVPTRYLALQDNLNRIQLNSSHSHPPMRAELRVWVDSFTFKLNLGVIFHISSRMGMGWVGKYILTDQNPERPYPVTLFLLRACTQNLPEWGSALPNFIIFIFIFKKKSRKMSWK